MAEAAIQFPFNTEGSIRDLIANAAPSIQDHYRGVLEEAQETEAERVVRVNKAADIQDEIEVLALQLHQAEMEEKRSGQKYYSERTERDPKDGGETTTRTETGYSQKIAAEIEAKKNERRALLDRKARKKWIAKVDDELGAPGVKLIPFGDPLEWSPTNGEQFGDGYNREFATLKTMTAKLTTTLRAPRTKAEMKATVCAEIDRNAVPPDFGGHQRGSSVAPHGGFQVKTNPRIGFHDIALGDQNFVVDAVKLVCFPFAKELKKFYCDYIDKNFSDEGAISAADKGPMVAKLEEEVWQQRRMVESAYLACRAAGLRKLNRPSDTPTEILLDVIPFNKARSMRVPPKPVEVNEEIDFEDAEADA